MASNFLNQKDIDKLLESIPEEAGHEEQNDKAVSKQDEKIYRFVRNPVERIRFPYRSPVLKSDQIAFDPEPGSPIDEDKIVVQSLRNFMFSRRTA